MARIHRRKKNKLRGKRGNSSVNIFRADDILRDSRQAHTTKSLLFTVTAL